MAQHEQAISYSGIKFFFPLVQLLFQLLSNGILVSLPAGMQEAPYLLLDDLLS